MEVRGYVSDRHAGRREHPLDRTEELAQDRDAGAREQVEGLLEERTQQAQALEALAPSEGAEKSGGLGGGERQEDVVAVAHQRGRLLGTAQSGSMVFGHDGSTC